jgi:hypothetical protein
MPHDQERDEPRSEGTGVGMDGTLHSRHEPAGQHGADRSGLDTAGVGTDGSVHQSHEPDDDRSGVETEGVGTDGTLHSHHESYGEPGADRSGMGAAGVGTDGSLVDPDKDVDPAFPTPDTGRDPHDAAEEPRG